MDSQNVEPSDDDLINIENNENGFLLQSEDENAQKLNDLNEYPQSIIKNENVRFCGKEFKISRPQLYILCLLCPYFFLTSSYYSLFAPFFPEEALKKGINQTQIGLIFGVFQFAFLLLAPIFGKYVSHF